MPGDPVEEMILKLQTTVAGWVRHSADAPMFSGTDGVSRVVTAVIRGAIAGAVQVRGPKRAYEIAQTALDQAIWPTAVLPESSGDAASRRNFP